MIKKVITAIAGVLVLGNVTIVSLSDECLRLNESQEEVVFNADVVLEGKINKACFELEADYQLFKEANFKRYHDNGNTLPAWEEGFFSPEFNAAEEWEMVINEEVERGNISEESLKDNSQFNSALQQITNDYNFSYFPDPYLYPKR